MARIYRRDGKGRFAGGGGRVSQGQGKGQGKARRAIQEIKTVENERIAGLKSKGLPGPVIQANKSVLQTIRKDLVRSIKINRQSGVKPSAKQVHMDTKSSVYWQGVKAKSTAEKAAIQSSGKAALKATARLAAKEQKALVSKVAPHARIGLRPSIVAPNKKGTLVATKAGGESKKALTPIRKKGVRGSILANRSAKSKPIFKITE